MAEFLLGRIKFVYQGNWTSDQSYLVDDVVTNSGKTYICVVNHSSSTFFNDDLTANPPRWNIVSDGQAWKGNWSTSTYYNEGDLVKYGGIVYICKTPHESASTTVLGLEDNLSDWEAFAKSFNWRTNWATSTQYHLGDIVAYGGNIYYCNTAHTSTSTASDGLEVDISKWDLFNSGITYIGNWSGSSVRYRVNDVVKFGANLWICTAAHTSSGTSVDQTKFSIFVNGFEFVSAWSNSTTYTIGDVVNYGGYSYIAKTTNLNKSPTLSTDDWAAFTTGFSYQGDWDNSISYLIGSVVRLNGYTYVATADSPTLTFTVTGTTAGSNLLTVAATTGLVAGKTIIFGSSVANLVTGKTYYVLPGATSTQFQVSETENGTPVALTTTTEQTINAVVSAKPPLAAYWTRLNQGFHWANYSQTYTGLTAINVSSADPAASGVEYTVVRNNTSYVLTRTNNGSNYTTGDVVKILGTSVGGLSPVNDITITLTASSGAVTSEVFTGFSSTWKSDSVYVLGDVVAFGANTYTCIQAHTANNDNRPDKDTTASFWTILAAGAEAAVLTTPGDTFFYGPNGPTRLPIGTNGQVLRSTNGYPSWQNYGLINNLVYVTPTGVDEPYPAQGATIDSAWKSVRYAAKQIEDGYLNKNAQHLLTVNKQFMIQEVYNFVTYTYKAEISGTQAGRFVTDSTANISIGMPISFQNQTGSLTLGGTAINANTVYYVKTIPSDTSFTVASTYNGTALVAGGAGTATAKYATSLIDETLRDTAIAIDAVIFDLGHGGNVKTTTAALAYYNQAGDAYFNNAVKSQIPQFIGAQNYLASLMANVLTNTAPDVNYQALNNISITSQALQRIDTSYISEDNTVNITQDLIGIIVAGLAAGSASAIKPGIAPNTTISVKTGTYNEVLPIVLPVYTAVVGDELRSTVIQPKAANSLLINDAEKTSNALNRIKSLIPSVVTNTSVVPTSGNTQVQKYLFADQENAATSRINSNLTVISNILANGLTAAPVYVLPTPTGGTGNGSDTGYLNASRLVNANKAFLQAEISAWIDAQIAANTPPFNGFVYAGENRIKCERDIGYIVDALRYDLMYGGNLATVIAARSYYSNGVLVEVGEKEQAKAVQIYLKSIIDDIVTGTAIVKTPANTQEQDISGTAGSAGAATFAQTRVQEMHDCIDTGTTPTTIAPDITWPASALTTFNTAIVNATSFIQEEVQAWIANSYPTLTYNKTLCNRDVGYIIDALRYDMMFGSNFLASWNAMSYYRSLSSTAVVLSDQFTAQVAMVGVIGAFLKQLTAGIGGSTGSLVATTRLVKSADTIYDIVNSGLGSVPTIILPTPTGYNTSSLTHTAYAATGNLTGSTATYGNGKAQIVQNYQFIKDDTQQYLANNYPSLWSSLGAEGQAKGVRDIGYILDALQYDLTYGGNTQSLIAGSAYWSFTISNLTLEEKEAFTSQLAYMKDTVLPNIVTATAYGKQSGTLTNQTTSGAAGNVASANFVKARVQDVIDWINNGYANTTIAPCTTWVSAGVRSALTALQGKKSEIQEDTLAHCKKFYQNVTFSQSLTLRDTGLLVDAVAYDTAFGSNFNGITAGRAYYRNTKSALALINSEEKAPVLGAISFIKSKAKLVVAGGSAAQIQTLIDDVRLSIAGGTRASSARLRLPNPSNINASYAAGKVLLNDNRDFILAETLAYIEATYPSLDYSKTLALRDAGFIIDALIYDLTYGGNFASKQAGQAYYSFATSQISSSLKTATLDTINHISTVAQAVAKSNTVTPTPGNTSNQIFATGAQAVGSNAVATKISELVTIIYNYVDLGLTNGAPVATITTIASGTTFTTSSAHGLSVGDLVIPQSTTNGLTTGQTYYVASTPLTTTFTLSLTFNGDPITTFTNGTGLSIKAEITKMPSVSWVDSELVGVYATLSLSKASLLASVISFIDSKYPNLTYDQDQAMRDASYALDSAIFDTMFGSNYRAIKDGQSYRRPQAANILGYLKDSTVESLKFLQTETTAIVSNIPTAVSRINEAMGIILDILENGIGELPELHGSNDYNNILSTIKGVELLRVNKEFLTYEATAWVNQAYGGTIADIAVTGNVITTSSIHNLTVGDPIIFGGTSAGGITVGTTYFVLTTPSSTTFTITAQQFSETPVTIASNVTTPTMTVSYAYDPVSCRRDMSEWLDALIYDLQYLGNYKAKRASVLYVNAVNGSATSDMWHVRNATGIRNMTMSGLKGSLTVANNYGTKRPTAGSYSSLDPGFGPNDKNVWITTRSCYAQNCTMFGTACTGMKIDGALHGGGYRSMVANDYTTILSDGIGVWATGSNALTELVSVFNYYGYAGYLAEYGARIRATNGNSSYGVYGVIAEGTDSYEQPINATLNNRGSQAYITNVFTDGINKVLRIEYANAGSNYTNAAYTISGSGYNAAAIGDEFRDSAVFETRLIDLNDSNGYGGSNYVSISNAAQGGNTTSITIAGADTALSTAYIGMRIVLIGGTGAGQYGGILSYNNGTKIALVFKESFDTLTVTNTTVTGNLLTVASTAKLYPGMPIYLDTTINGVTANTLYYVRTTGFTGTQFSISETGAGGSAVVINTTGAVSIKLYAAGWDHVVPGTASAAALDLSSTYLIEPRITYTDPGFTSFASTITSASYGALSYGSNHYVATNQTGTTTSYSTDGKTWSSAGAVSNVNWADVVYGGGEGAEAIAIIGGLGGSGAVLTATLGSGSTAGQVVSVNVINGGEGYTTPPTIVFTPVSGGMGASATAVVLNGVITSVTMNITGSGYSVAPTVSARTDIISSFKIVQSGRNYTSVPTVTVSGGGSTNQATGTAVLSNEGVLSITVGNAGGSGYTSVPTVTITDTNAKFVAIPQTGASAANYSTVANLGSAWTVSTGNLPAGTYTSAAFGVISGVPLWAAVGGSSAGTVSSDGDTWTAKALPTLSGGSYSSVAYGNNTFVAISTGNNATAIYSSGGNWQTGGNLPSSTTWTSIAYGNGRFVAIASGGTSVAYSLDSGATWTAAAPGLPASATWTSIGYGQGLFFAVASGTNVCATSSDGVTWAVCAMPSTSNWKAVAFGNTNKKPTWVAVSASSGTTASYAKTGARAQGRMKVVSGAVAEIRMTEPGSGYPAGNVTSTSGSTTITLDASTNLILNQPIEFAGCDAAGLDSTVTYYVKTISGTDITVSTSSGGTAVSITPATLSGTYQAGPIATQTDPNKVKTAATRVRMGTGVLGNPTFSNRGTGNTAATANVVGDGYADLYQPVGYINVENLYDVPTAGANLVFDSIPNTYFKLVSVTNLAGTPGNYTATFQINPSLTVLNAPNNGDVITTRLSYSQVRLTGHDFLYIGTGNFSDTNYPNVPVTNAVQANQTLGSNGGRVFFTSTDQDGNFNVGNLFGVQQATGTATLNASAFNLSGLQSLQLGSVSVGSGSAIISQFSTDPYFTANSDNIVPTQRAIKSYITAQIGGGQSQLNVNTLTAGIVYIAGNTISTTTGGQIIVNAKMNFTGGIDGTPVALGFFMQK